MSFIIKSSQALLYNTHRSCISNLSVIIYSHNVITKLYRDKPNGGEGGVVNVPSLR